jgi:hypothetical protein
MSQPTQIDPDTFNKVIQGHSDVHTYITQQQAHIGQEVQNAAANNSGQMITSLVNVHTDWDDKMKDILTNLEQMISDLQETFKKLFHQDAANTVRS